jgi:hypothetical protein
MAKFKNFIDNPRIVSQFDLIKMLRLKKDEAKEEFIKRSLEGCEEHKYERKDGSSSN